VPNPLTRLTNQISPPRLGTDFRWLLGSALVNNLGDGITLAAGPLLIASLTQDPLLVSLGVLFRYLPLLVFGVIGGVAADRFHRRRMVIVANLLRVAVLLVLIATIVTGSVSIALVLAAVFMLGTAETFADSASSTFLPSLVRREDLGVANARSQGAYILANDLVGPPIGAFLFVVGMAVPFAANAAAFLLGAVLITRIVSPAVGRAREPGEGVGMWSDLVEGIRWLIGHPPMRTLALTIISFNVTYGATMGVMVLYATQHLHMSEVGFGLLTTAAAVGGAIGTFSYGALERRFSLANIMRAGLVIETATHIILALTTSAEVALAVMVVSGAHGFVWHTTATTVRQRAVPDELMGRVGGVYRVSNVGGLVVGIPIGGALAGAFGILAPFWFGFVGSAVLVVLLWRRFALIAHD
jgi:predicted MFS family arabinose efflux permease